MTDRTCSIDGCERLPRSGKAEWCNAHYFRNRRNGHPERSVYAEKRVARCRESGCEMRPRGWGWCKVHYVRWWRHGDPQVVLPHGAWRGEQVTYRGLHARLARARGLASEYKCSCGAAAEQWAYDHTDLSPKYSENGSPYSLEIKRYQPMCRSCHGKLDWSHR